jgi:hypothetical protein
MTQARLSDLQRAEAAYLAANWKAMPRSQRRNVVRLWWKTGVRHASTFGDSWRTIASTIRNANP